MSEGKQRDFYKSGAWVNCRNNYMKSVGGLCEICKEKGLIVPAIIVHHKVHLNAENLSDPNVSLNFNNLQAVCRDCHARLHGKEKRYFVREDGTVEVIAPFV